MAITGNAALALSKKYTNDSLDGVGALKGKNCTIDNIGTDSDGNSVVTFKWTDDNNVVHTSEMTVSKGNDGISVIALNIVEGHLICTLSDDSTIDAGSLPDTEVKISQAPNNILVEKEDGLYVSKQEGGGGGASTAEDVSYENVAYPALDNVKKTLDNVLDKIYYVAPSISSFTASPTGGTYEIGRKIASITFNWAVNKTIARQALTGCTVTADDRTATYDTEISSGKTFTLTVEDSTGSKASKSISYLFLPRVYYGGASLPETVDSAFVTGLTKGDFKSSASGTYTMTPADGQYGFVAIPSVYSFSGTAKVGGFDTDLTLVDEVSVTNASGYTQNYKVWRMPNPSAGTQISIVI